MSDKFYVYIDEKVTTWIRHTIEVRGCQTLEEAQSKVIANYQDLWGTKNLFPVETEELCDTEEPMSVQENGNSATIEVLDSDYIPIWDNVNGKLD